MEAGLPLLASLATLALLSCGRMPPERPAAPSSPEARVIFDGPTTCLSGGGREAGALRDEAALASWFQRVACGRGTLQPVDFARDVVLAASDVAAPNRCHDLELRAERREEGVTELVVTRLVPAPDRMCATVMVVPAAAVAVPRESAREVRVTWREAVAQP